MPKTHCPQGHPYTERDRRPNGHLHCRVCTNARLSAARTRPISVTPAEIPALLERLAKRRNITAEGCWEWTGASIGDGYGQMRYRCRSISVHRLVAHAFHGLDIDDRKLVARHKCDNPPCFNPDHIEVGTYSDNVQDALARGRWFKGYSHCSKGHEMSGENLKVSTSGRRVCATCRRERNRANYYARKVLPDALDGAE